MQEIPDLSELNPTQQLLDTELAEDKPPAAPPAVMIEIIRKNGRKIVLEPGWKQDSWSIFGQQVSGSPEIYIVPVHNIDICKVTYLEELQAPDEDPGA